MKGVQCVDLKPDLIVQMNYNNKKAGVIYGSVRVAVSKPDSETGYKANHRNNSKNEHLSNPPSLAERQAETRGMLQPTTAFYKLRHNKM